jgi:hypothetical protein
MRPTKKNPPRTVALEVLESGETYSIGTIETALTNHELRSRWEQWRTEVAEPEADSDFINWLEAKGLARSVDGPEILRFDANAGRHFGN